MGLDAAGDPAGSVGEHELRGAMSPQRSVTRCTPRDQIGLLLWSWSWEEPAPRHLVRCQVRIRRWSASDKGLIGSSRRSQRGAEQSVRREDLTGRSGAAVGSHLCAH